MDTFGSPIRPRANSASWGGHRRHSRRAQSWRRAIGVLAALGLLLVDPATTSAQTLMMGEAPKVDGLKSLVSGVSTAEEVLAKLGTPRGTGAMRHSPEQPLRTVWFYELVMMKGDQVHLNILLVYLNRNLYDGHLWFSANELVSVSGRIR